MKIFGANISIAICGLITSILVATANVVVANFIGLNAFTFSLWLIVPVGAIALGMAAASGYYFGALHFHIKPRPILLVQMVLIAAATQFLIYYMEYTTMIVDGNNVSEFLDFREYMDISLTKAHYSVGRSRIDTGEIGTAGYWFAGLQFIGFLLGGVAVYIMLASKLVCSKCQNYYELLAEKVKIFPNTETCGNYYDVIYTLPFDSQEFANLIWNETNVRSIRQGNIKITTFLYDCPNCKCQLLSDSVSVFNGDDWKDVPDFNRNILVPENIDLWPLFKG